MTTRIAIMSDTDPLDSVRRTVAFADEAIALGATVVVTGELSINVHFETPGHDPDEYLDDEPEVPSGGPD